MGLLCLSLRPHLYLLTYLLSIVSLFPVTSQTLENCSEEVRNVVALVLKGAADTQPTTTTTMTLLVPATPSTSGALPLFDPVTMSAPQGPLSDKTFLHNLIWCLVFSTKTWWLVCSFVA